MLILLDENMPHRLRLMLPGHDVRTTAYQDWSGLTNGSLLRGADQGIRYQNNRTAYRLALIVLSTNKESLILAGVDAILAALSAATSGALVYVDLES